MAIHMMLHCCPPNQMPHEARPCSSPGAPSRGHCGYGACVHHALPWLISKTSNGAGRRSLSSAHPQTLPKRRRAMCCVHLPQGLGRSVEDWLAGLPRCNYSPPEVISVIPNQHHELMTTRSWDFLGMNLNHKPPSKLLQRSKYGEDVIIGIVDTGQSFIVIC